MEMSGLELLVITGLGTATAPLKQSAAHLATLISVSCELYACGT